MEGAELASTAEEDGVENLFGANAGIAATIRQGRCQSREVEHFIQINLQLVPDQASRGAYAFSRPSLCCLRCSRRRRLIPQMASSAC